MELDQTRWRKVREKALKRDGGRCKKCGGKAEDVHHKLMKSKHPHLAYTLSNLISLCEHCHMAIHKSQNDECYQYIKDHYRSKSRRVERRTGLPNHRINYHKMRLTYRVVKGTRVSHNWRRPKR